MAEQTQTLRTQAITAVGRGKGGLWASKQFQENFIAVVATILATLGLILVLFPIFWMLSTSLKGQIEAMKMPPNWIPAHFQWRNYYDAMTTNPFFNIPAKDEPWWFWGYFANSFFFSISVMLGETLSCSFIGYGFARLRAPGRDYLFLLVLATLMIPNEVTLIPQYVLFSKIGWTNSYRPLIVPAWFGSAYLIFLVRQFYMGLPKEYDEAAVIEGASHLQIWSRIILPLSKPAIGAMAIMSFIYHWNTFQGPLIYLSDNKLFTVSLGLSMFRTPFGGTPWHWYMAASLVTILPCVVVFFFAQRYFIQGIVISGVKG
jgi:ABC-type glycerol-3-phosphate transport system permease component